MPTFIADDVADIARRMREIKGEPEPPIVADGGSVEMGTLLITTHKDGWAITGDIEHFGGIDAIKRHFAA